MSRKKIIITATALMVMIGATAGIVWKTCLDKPEESVVYKETEVCHGKLTVGITESGNVEVGTTTQEFELDISTYTGAQESSGQSNPFSFGGGGMPGQSQQNNSGSSDSRNLTVEEVYVSVGQEISKGDPIYRLSEESVEEIRDGLSEDVEEASLDLKQARTKLKQIQLSASHDLETDSTYGAAAEIAYEESLTELQESYDDAAESLEKAKEELEELQEEEAELQEKLKESTHLYEESAYLADYIDLEDDPYGYINAINLRDSTEKTKEDDEDNLENKQDEIEEKQKEIETLTEALATAEKEQKTGAITARADYDTRVYRLANATELYNVTVGIGEQDVAEAEDAYTEAKEKLDDFDASIQDCNVLSEYSGVITGVEMSVGDTLSRGSSLLILKDYGEASVTVTVEDEDIDKIAIGDTVNVSVSAFPEELFQGAVSEIGDAVVNTYSSTITYDVTVDINGDVSGIYSGMTSDVTFITRETKEVTYVLNRAVNRDGTRSYVYIRDAEGNVVEQDIRTGFSDGANVEVLDGLKEGDIVLIESKVSEK